MEMWWYGILALLSVAVILLGGCVLSLRHAVREIAAQLDTKLHSDTNTTLSISSGDRRVRQLAVKINRELRELRTQRLRLQNGDTALKEAITNVSHDLRTPLTAICGYLDLLETEELHTDGRRYLAVIRERTETMRRMTEELLQYSVVTADPTALSLTPVRMNDVLAESLAGFYGALCAKGITPEIRMAEHTVVRLLHAESLRRVFDNILQNAVRYAVRDLCVTLSEEGNVTFANHAPEMSPVQVERLFDSFYTVETARSTTGLGLSIARQLTEKMHGRIDADYENGILTICLRFPQVQDNAPERSTAIKER